MLNVAKRLPTAVGSKVTEIVQLAPATIDVPQVLVSLKSAGSVPVIAMLVNFSVSVPESVRVIVCAALAAPTPSLAKVRLVGLSLACGTPTLSPVMVKV